MMERETDVQARDRTIADLRTQVKNANEALAAEYVAHAATRTERADLRETLGKIRRAFTDLTGAVSSPRP